MADLIFHGQFIDKTNLDGETGLTVTVDVYRTAISDGTTSQVVTGGSCTETGGGIYRYRLAGADLSLYHYVANMKTTSADVAQKHIAALGLVVPDELVSSRLAASSYTEAPTASENATATLAAMNDDPPAVNVSLWASGSLPVIPGVQDVRDAMKLAPSSGAAAAGSVDAKLDALDDAIDLIGGEAGSGAIETVIVVNDENSNPLDGVECWITTDSAGSNVVAGTLSTNALGRATFMLDAGAYYLWRQLAGYNFANPTLITVS